MQTVDMFPEKKSRQPRRILARVADAAADDPRIVVFQCAKCGWKSEWMKCDTVAAAKRGHPCEQCN